MKLTKKQLDAVQAIISPKTTRYQAGRICDLLADGEVRTGVIAGRCSVGNLSDVVNNTINPQIAELGLWIGCVKPPNAIRNKFGQRAGDHLWSFRKVEEAANDPEWEQEGSTVEDWEKQLGDIDLDGLLKDVDKDLDELLKDVDKELAECLGEIEGGTQ